MVEAAADDPPFHQAGAAGIDPRQRTKTIDIKGRFGRVGAVGLNDQVEAGAQIGDAEAGIDDVGV